MRDWMVEAIGRHGHFGVLVLMFLQNVIPFIPSEIIMPLAGFLASLGWVDLHACILAGMLGSLLGDLPWYFLGMALGEERLALFVQKYGRWLGLKAGHVHRAEHWFERNRTMAVLLGRLLSAARTYVNVPAGVSRMAFIPFLLLTLTGEAAWTALLAYGGYWLGRDYLRIALYFHFIFAFLVVAAIFAVWWVLKRRRAA